MAFILLVTISCVNNIKAAEIKDEECTLCFGKITKLLDIPLHGNKCKGFIKYHARCLLAQFLTKENIDSFLTDGIKVKCPICETDTEIPPKTTLSPTLTQKLFSQAQDEYLNLSENEKKDFMTYTAAAIKDAFIEKLEKASKMEHIETPEDSKKTESILLSLTQALAKIS